MNKSLPHLQSGYVGSLTALEVLPASAFPFTKKNLLEKPDLGHEQVGILHADAVRLQTIVAQAQALIGSVKKLQGEMLTNAGTEAFSDFGNSLSDLTSELEHAYTNFDQEIDSRSAER